MFNAERQVRVESDCAALLSARAEELAKAGLMICEGKAQRLS